MPRLRLPPRLLAIPLALALLPACSVRQTAVRSLSDVLVRGEAAFATDDDPELVAEASAFSLKAIETLLAESPRDRRLLLAAARGFTGYTFAFLQQEADFVEAQDLSRATALRERAVKLYLRGRDYGLRGLEVDFAGFGDRLRRDAPAALGPLQAKHVPLLYWTAAAWSRAMALRKDDSALSADQGLAAAMMQRGLELDEAYGLGVLHDFFIVQQAVTASVGGSLAEAREHYVRALALAGGRRVWPYVHLAEAASVAAQDRAEFERALKEGLALDADRTPDQRLSNLVAQRRARWLLARVDELFVD